MKIDFDINTYKHMCAKQRHCAQKNAARFIFDGSTATKIKYRCLRNQAAALMVDTREGPDKLTVFSLRKQTAADELLKGDYFSQEGKPASYFIYEDVELIRDELYKKQLAYECNVVVNNYDECFSAYYVSSLTKMINDGLEKELSIASIDKPIAVFPKREGIEIGTILIIGGRVFKITEVDDITNSGIAYCSLSRTFKSKDVGDGTEEVEDESNVLYAGVEIELTTADAYFAATPAVTILHRSSSKIRFVIPFDVISCTISVKDDEGEIVTTNYTVR